MPKKSEKYIWKEPDFRDLEANLFALHLLMPDDKLEGALGDIGHKIDLLKDDNEDIAWLAQKFGVSKSMVLIRVVVKYFDVDLKRRRS